MNQNIEDDEIIDELDITNLVDITVKFSHINFYNQCIYDDSLTIGLNELDKAIEINKELITCLDKIENVDVIAKYTARWEFAFDSKKKAIIELSNNLGISTGAANYFFKLSPGYIYHLKISGFLENNERLLLLKKHLENFKKELNEKFEY